MNAIELKNVNFKYNGCKKSTLFNIHFKVKKGEFILLTGRSGCGKTTLTRIINGLIPSFYEGTLTGDITIYEKNIKSLSSYELAKQIGSVFQDPRSQFFTTTTTSEVAFGCENLGISSKNIKTRVEKAFKMFNIESLYNKSIFNLSSGEKQKIALASIYAMQPSIYVLDEPSANLDMTSTKVLAELLQQLKDEGNTIIISEHRLYYLMDLVDRTLYIEDGHIINEWTQHDCFNLSQKELFDKGLRTFDLNKLSVLDKQINLIEKIHDFKVTNLSCQFKNTVILDTINIDKSQSNTTGIIGIVGPNGIGKTTLIKAICGLIKIKKGAIKKDNQSIPYKKRPENTYLVMQDTDYQLFTDSLINELKLGHKPCHQFNLSVDKYLNLLGLSDYEDCHPMALSGGQKQRLTIACAAVSDAKILFFDEPTSGLDGKNMRAVGNILKELHKIGKLIFVISHDIEFLISTCSEIMYLNNKHIAENFYLSNDTLERLKNILL